MKVALAQMDVKANMPRQNLETMLEMIDQAKAAGADIVAFPEMCVGGYLVGDRWTEDRFVRNLLEYNEPLRKASEGIVLMYGNVAVDEGAKGKDGRSRKFNAAYIFDNGKPAERARAVPALADGITLKTLLPTYRMFDDARYFFGANDLAIDLNIPLEEILQPFAVNIRGRTINLGVELCEDLWCADYRKNGEALNPTKYLLDNGAGFIFNLSASPWTFGKNEARDHAVQFIKAEVGDKFKPFFYVNKVGVQNNGKNIVTFDGGTTVYNADAKPCNIIPQQYTDGILLADMHDLADAQTAPEVQRPQRDKIEEKYNAIIRGIQHVKDIVGAAEHPKHVIGLSGGIDSAVAAALIAAAIGRDKVIGVNLPTQYNSSKTKGIAAHVAKELGIAYDVIPIENLARQNIDVLNAADLDGTGRQLSMLNEENVQAKIRGTNILSNLAAKYGAIFTNNGNKLETALGYATLYGDVGGAYAPLADLTKTEVFDLARYINKRAGKEIIPAALLPDELFRFKKDQMPPSAELKEAQIDPMKFGYHDALLEAYTDYRKKGPEDVMQWYLNGTLADKLHIKPALLTRWGLDDPKEFITDLEWFDTKYRANVFKRIQGPPTIITSKTAFGFDLRESMLPNEQTLAYERLKEQVLCMQTYHEHNHEDENHERRYAHEEVPA